MKGSAWISVKERYPDKEGHYLVYCGTILDTESWDVSPFLVDYFGNRDKNDPYFDEYEDADYWMPLPEPPIIREKIRHSNQY